MLTQKQIEEARKKLGLNADNPSASTASTLVQRLEAKRVKESSYIDRLKGAFSERKENVQDINSGNASLPEKILQNVGQIAGGVSDIVAEAPVVRQGLELAGKGIKKVAEVPGIKQVVEKGVETYESLPEGTRKNLEAVGNIGSIIPVGLGAKGVAVAGEKALVKGAKAAGKVKSGVSAGKKVVGEIIPTADRYVNSQVSKALDLTAGDIKNINLSTGNEVGEFMARKNLIRGNKDETTKALSEFFDTNYKTVRDEIGKVKKTYSPYNVPRYTESLKAIKKQVDDVAGLEQVSVQVDNLLNKAKDEIVLSDVQQVKELLDEHFNLYKVTGDVKEGVAKEGLSNLRKDLKEFIEKEVKDNTGADIAGLNNEVSTAKSTLNAIEERSTRGLTASNLKLGDMASFGVGTMFGGPLVGLAAVAAKKIVETSAFRLKTSKLLDAWSDAKKLKVRQELLKGNVPPEIKSIINQSSVSKKATTVKKTLSKNSIPKTIPKTTPKVNVPKELEPLAKEARKYKSAEEFVKAHQDGKTGISFHITDNPNFKIKSDLIPADTPTGSVIRKTMSEKELLDEMNKSVAIFRERNFDKSFIDNFIKQQTKLAKGGETGQLMVTKDITDWMTGKLSGDRKFVAIIDTTGNAKKTTATRGFGNETLIQDPQNSKLLGLYPVKEAKSIINKIKKSEQLTKSQLTDFYNKAVKNK